VGESPAETAVREAREEIGVEVRVRLIDGDPAPDHDEVDAAAWFGPEELDDLSLNRFSLALLTAIGRLAPGAVVPAGEDKATRAES
jgi:hypothetical protein